MMEIPVNKNAPIAIIGAMSQEVEILVESLISPEEHSIAGMNFYSGLIDGCHVVLTQCGIGKVNATMGVSVLVERFAPRAIINTGSAGGIGKGLAVGDVVISDRCVHHDVDVTAFGYAHGQMAQMPLDYSADSSLVDRAKIAADAFPDGSVHRGLIASGDAFIHRPDQFEYIRQHFPDVLAVDMEAAAIAQTCYRFNLPFVVIRALSDLADEQASVSFETFIEKASKHSADMVVRLLASLKN